MNLTHEDVQEILRLLEASSFDELRLETERFRLILRRGGGDGGWTQETETLSKARVEHELGPSPDAVATVQSSQTAPHATATFEIRPPIIGTFYRAPKPGAPPFVEVGSRVREDTVVAIIETMKLMNSIPAGVRGRVVEICVADAEFVEQDRVLMRVAPETE